MSKLTDLKNKMDALKKEAESEAKRLFKEEVKFLFDKYPDLTQFSWTQYTPYFNDGDTCYFSSHHEYPTILLKGGEDEGEYEETYAGDQPENLVKEIEEAVRNFLRQFDDDLMEAMFGDHARVVVTQERVEVEEHDHG